MLDINNLINDFLNKKVKITTYPLYYEENGSLVRENKDGSKYIIELDKKNNEKIIKKIK